MVLVVATILAQAAIFLTRNNHFWMAAGLQIMSFAMAVGAERIARDYYHNQVTAYPVWSNILWLGAIELALLAAIIYIWKK